MSKGIAKVGPDASEVEKLFADKFNQALEKGLIKGLTLVKKQLNIRISTSSYSELSHFAAQSGDTPSSFAVELLEAAIKDYSSNYDDFPSRGTEEWLELFGDQLSEYTE